MPTQKIQPFRENSRFLDALAERILVGLTKSKDDSGLRDHIRHMKGAEAAYLVMTMVKMCARRGDEELAMLVTDVVADMADE